MKIKIKSSSELDKLLFALGDEIVLAYFHYKLICDLTIAYKENSIVIQQSRTFWSMAFDALRDAMYLRLCRIYDQESTSLNLINLLDTFKSNKQYFSKEYFQGRIKDKPRMGLLTPTTPNDDEIKADQKLVSCENPIVKKLMIWRNNIIAHRGSKVSMGNNKVLKDNKISEDETKELIDQSFDIFNKYSNYYNAAITSRIFIGGDDYKSIFKYVRDGIEQYEIKIKEDILKFKKLSDNMQH